MPNKVAYFDISIAGEPAGRIEFELFDDVVPKVCSWQCPCPASDFVLSSFRPSRLLSFLRLTLDRGQL